jgi:6-phosphogluconate dehydrogenase
MMVPAAVLDQQITDSLPLLNAADILIDGGNSYYVDGIRRAKDLAPRSIHLCGCWNERWCVGSERGYCTMIRGETEIVEHLDPIFTRLAPDSASRFNSPSQQEPATSWLSILGSPP